MSEYRRGAGDFAGFKLFRENYRKQPEQKKSITINNGGPGNHVSQQGGLKRIDAMTATMSARKQCKTFSRKLRFDTETYASIAKIIISLFIFFPGAMTITTRTLLISKNDPFFSFLHISRRKYQRHLYAIQATQGNFRSFGI